MCIVCILWCSCFSCANSPYWLISDSDLCHLFWFYTLESNFKLSSKNFFELSTFSLFQCFSNTKIYVHTTLKSKKNLTVDDFICFTIVLSSFTVTKNNCIDTKILKHQRRNFTCVSARLVISHIFCSNNNWATLYSFYNTWKINIWACNHTLAVCTTFLVSISKFFCILLCFAWNKIHLPVTSDIWSSLLCLLESFDTRKNLSFQEFKRSTTTC